MSIDVGVFSYDEVHDMCRKIANNVTTKYDHVIGISRGGVIPATILSHLLDLSRVRVHQIHDSIGKVITSPGNYLIVDEIFDTGETLKVVANKIDHHVKSMFLPGDVVVDYAVLLLNADAVSGYDKVLYHAETFNRRTNSTWFHFPWET